MRQENLYENQTVGLSGGLMGDMSFTLEMKTSLNFN